jgi:ribonuclease BN (tRNA processing enzyme)
MFFCAQLLPPSAWAKTEAEPSWQWVALGTQGGPVPSKLRSQPANLIVGPDSVYLVDAGDAAVTQIAASGQRLASLKAIFLSHLHFDHIGGLFGVLGIRNQERIATPLTIYGPPGTKRLVNGLLQAMGPSSEAGYGIPGEVPVPASSGIHIVELDDGTAVSVGAMTVRVARNSHYSFDPGSAKDRNYKSFSYRFDLPGRSIAYTGDTGASSAVTQLVAGADLLVSEMIDLTAVEKGMAASGRKSDPVMLRHLADHHLSTTQIGDLAQSAGVKKVVLTHIAGGGARDADAAQRYTDEVKRRFAGEVSVANDLDRF